MRKLMATVDTTTGLFRAENEDAHFIDTRRRFFAVADGIGGLPHGSTASAKAVDEVQRRVSKPPLLPPIELTIAVFRDVSARLSLCDIGLFKGMGTTLVTAAIDYEKTYAVIGNVGDSRAYLLRRGKLHLLTKDQSVNGALTGAITTDRATKPTLIEVELESRDTLLLCSDGVSNELPKARIHEILSEDRGPVATRLIEATTKEGDGSDNATALIIRIK